MAQVHELPNRLFSQGRSVLAKFGYRHLEAGESRDDWAKMWAHLVGDFPTGRSYDEMTADQQALAQDYMRCRLIADHNLETCENLHVDLFSRGIGTELVERYAQARDTYEDSVEAFGKSRERLDAALNG